MNAWVKLLIGLLIALLPSVAIAKHQYPENWYQSKWCWENDGRIEVVLPDKTRCDCLTPTHAIEFDFARKWAEAIGQALYYSFQTGKKAGVVLILEKEADRIHWIRLNSVIQHYRLPIDTWQMRPTP